MDDIYKSTEEHNLNKKRKILTIFGGMISNMLSTKKLNPVVAKLLFRRKKLNISLGFIAKSYLAALKYIRLNSAYYFIIKINKSFNKLYLIIHQIFNLETL